MKTMTQPLSSHFQDFAPVLFTDPSPTYPDEYKTGMQGRWFTSAAGVLWTDDDTLLGLDTTNAVDWDLVVRIRTELVEAFFEKVSATMAFNQLQDELDPEEWDEGNLGDWTVRDEPAEG